MHGVTGILGDQLVDAYRKDVERALIDHEQRQIARKQSVRVIAKSRHFAGALIIGVGKVVQGRHLVEPRIDPDPNREVSLNLAA